MLVVSTFECSGRCNELRRGDAHLLHRPGLNSMARQARPRDRRRGPGNGIGRHSATRRRLEFSRPRGPRQRRRRRRRRDACDSDDCDCDCFSDDNIMSRSPLAPDDSFAEQGASSALPRRPLHLGNPCVGVVSTKYSYLNWIPGHHCGTISMDLSNVARISS